MPQSVQGCSYIADFVGQALGLRAALSPADHVRRRRETPPQPRRLHHCDLNRNRMCLECRHDSTLAGLGQARQLENERASASNGALGRDCAVVAFNDTFTDRES
jgi:hypothetical protein